MCAHFASGLLPSLYLLRQTPASCNLGKPPEYFPPSALSSPLASPRSKNYSILFLPSTSPNIYYWIQSGFKMRCETISGYHVGGSRKNTGLFRNFSQHRQGGSPQFQNFCYLNHSPKKPLKHLDTPKISNLTKKNW